MKDWRYLFMIAEKKYYCVYNTIDDLDDIILTSDDSNSLTGLFFINDNTINTNQYQINNELHIFKATKKWLDNYFKGINNDFTPPYILPNVSKFRTRVWEITKTIPYGHTISYGEIAKIIAEENKIKKCQPKLLELH